MLFISNFVLELINLLIMKKNRKILLITSILIMLVFLGFIIINKGADFFRGLKLIIIVLMIIIGVIALVTAYKKDKEEKEGFPSDDELSTLIKYKSGYYAYLASMYMWMFIFLFKDKFPNIESMIGGGILLSGLIGFLSKSYVKQNFNE
jgi:Ca2+/Na+ antiporter